MRCFASAALVAILALHGPALAWWGHGHALLTRGAVRCLPDQAPVFFRAGAETIAHVVYDPDLFKNRAAPHLYNAEHGEHYLDLELLQGTPLPSTRYAFYDTCAALGVNPTRVGTLPYAVAEWTERLQIAFAEHRKWPDDPIIQQKCLIFAGMLAHYAQDACQPLHVTIDFDGRKRADGTVEGKGVHEKMDALVQRLELVPDQLAEGVEVRFFEDLMAGILAEIDSSRTHIEAVYNLASVLDDTSHAPVRALGLERSRAAAGFTASLFWTAWRASEQVELPGWHQR